MLADDVDRDGYGVVRGLFDSATVAEATVALDALFAAEADIAAERQWLTDEYRVSYAIALKDPVLLAASTAPEVVEVARSVLGSDCVLAGANGLDLVTRGAAQPLHRDHPEPIPGTTVYLHIVVALDAFTADNGATRVVPGSHRDLRDEIDPTTREDEAVVVPIAAGDAVALDGCVIHAAGANRTDGPRRALHLFFSRWWAKPHWDLPAGFSPEAAEALSAEQRAVLGFDHRPMRFDLDARRIDR